MVKPWDSPRKPKKRHQDKIHAALCLIIALQWRRQSNVVWVIGNLDKGYIVTPTSGETRPILRDAANENEVDISPKQWSGDRLDKTAHRLKCNYPVKSL